MTAAKEQKEQKILARIPCHCVVDLSRSDEMPITHPRLISENKIHMLVEHPRAGCYHAAGTWIIRSISGLSDIRI